MQRHNDVGEARPRGAASRWDGVFAAGASWATWRGFVGDSTLHRHLAAQVVIADGPIVVCDEAGRRHEGRCVLIDPLVAHRVEAAPEAELIFVEPTAGQVEPWIERRIESACSRERPLLLSSPVAPRRFWTVDRASATARGPGPHPDVERLQSALHHIDEALEGGVIRLADVAGLSGLSCERFRHLFVAATGLSVRRYVLWRRIGRAVAELDRGAGTTAAAHAAGFADGAHFARTFKAMFGISPSALASRVNIRP